MIRMRPVLCVLAALAAGLAWGQEETLDEKLAKVRRERKEIDLDTSLARVPALVRREMEYQEVVERLYKTAQEGGDLKPLFERGRALKLQTLAELNDILDKHEGPYAGISEEEVWNRLRGTVFEDGLAYKDEWLVNILDDLEEKAQINIELDARVYKFDVFSVAFEKTSARAMLQIMADSLLFEWVVRGDTLYVYKERNEILFGGDWLKQKKAAYEARKKALEAAEKEVEQEALEKDEPAEGGAKEDK